MSLPNPAALNADDVKRFARGLGFDPVGIAGPEDFAEAEQAIAARVAGGLMAGLAWFGPDRATMACRPRSRFPWLRSIISMAFPYYPLHPSVDSVADEPGAGLHDHISRYAWGQDYHKVVGGKLAQLSAWLQQAGGVVSTKAYVDTGPVPERAAGLRASIGWFGKNTNLLTSRHGSWAFLAELFTDLALKPDVPLRKSCGRCTVCLAACPTGALVAPYVLDNSRCISFLTIELRGSIPLTLRPQMGTLIFGCDICQTVCPVNTRREPSPPQSASANVESLIPLLSLDEDAFRRRFQGTAVRRAGWAGFLRNVAVALGNAGDSAAVPALSAALEQGPPLLRSHAAWSLGRLGGWRSRTTLRHALDSETDPDVVEEIHMALDRSTRLPDWTAPPR